MAGGSNPWPFYSCSETFCVGGAFKDMLVMYIPFPTRLNGGYPYERQYCKPRAKRQAEHVHALSATLNFSTPHSLHRSEK